MLGFKLAGWFLGLKNVCKSHQCVSCCYHTEMLLLQEDIVRIAGLGYDEKFFTITTPDGFRALKNSRKGRCVFHDGTECTIYENRPKGCKLYPIIFDEDSMSAVKDVLCPYRSEFSLSHKSKKDLSIVYPRLLLEKSERMTKDIESNNTPED
jgi:Fe-S-cluster containining protein